MTEAAPGVLVLDRAHAAEKIGSAGVPSFFTDVRVAGPVRRAGAAGGEGRDRRQRAQRDEGYWGRPEATAEVLRDGWFHSGDVATVDGDGYFHVVDRLKDMIISGGENIYPAEVENELYGYPGVEACAVIGVPDPRWGEVGKAVVVPAAGSRIDGGELLAWLRTRLAGYKVPKSVEFTDRLPTTGSGKILKGEVRRRFGCPRGPARPAALRPRRGGHRRHGRAGAHRARLSASSGPSRPS